MIRVSNDLGPGVTHNDNADNDYDDDETNWETKLIFPHKETLEESQDSGCGSGNDTQVRISRE